MKQLIIIPALLFSALCFSQTKVLCLAPSCPQTIMSDTGTVFTDFTVPDGVKSVSWVFKSGPATPVMASPVTTWITGIAVRSTVALSKLSTPGTYVFQATGISTGGSTATVTDSLTVLPQMNFIDSVKVFYHNGKTVVQK